VFHGHISFVRKVKSDALCGSVEFVVGLVFGCGHVNNPWILARNSCSKWCVRWWTALEKKGYILRRLILFVLEYATSSSSCFEVGETGFNSS
jgi:hypothetical protein